MPLSSPTHYFRSFKQDYHGPGGATTLSNGGHQYILVIPDYATRYPEAMPLRTRLSKGIALIMIFFWVGILDEILTDQETLHVTTLEGPRKHITITQVHT
jgi:hypothetical protein